MPSKKAMNRKTNRTCSRCHYSMALSFYTKDDTICDPCIEIKPKGQQRKGKKIIDPDEVKYSEIWGSCGLYN